MGLNFVSNLGKAAMGALDKIDDFIPDAGDIAEKVCDTILPAKYEWVGDAASLATNLVSQNWWAAASDVADLHENVERGDFSFDPGPPPRRACAPAINCDPEQAPPSNQREDASAPPATPSTDSTGATGNTAGGDEPASVKKEKAQAFLKLDNDALMDAVRKGNIPDGVGEDPKAMATLQTRLHDIQQMNALMTNLLRALHEMQMEIIRNVRA